MRGGKGKLATRGTSQRFASMQIAADAQRSTQGREQLPAGWPALVGAGSSDASNVGQGEYVCSRRGTATTYRWNRCREPTA